MRMRAARIESGKREGEEGREPGKREARSGKREVGGG
jgi:hypothetical protein